MLVPWRRPNNGACCHLSPDPDSLRLLTVPVSSFPLPAAAIRDAGTRPPYRYLSHAGLYIGPLAQRPLLPAPIDDCTGTHPHNQLHSASDAPPRPTSGDCGCAGTTSVQLSPSNACGSLTLSIPCSAHGSRPSHGSGNTCQNGRGCPASSRR